MIHACRTISLIALPLLALTSCSDPQAVPGDHGADAPALDRGAPDAPLDMRDAGTPDAARLDRRAPDVLPVDLPRPDGAVPDAPAPDQALPDQALPDAPLPDLPSPDQALPDATIPDLPLPDLPVPDLPVPDLLLPDLPVPDLTPPDQTVPDAPLPDTKPPLTAPQLLVKRLDGVKFKGNIVKLAGFGSRYWSAKGNDDAASWLKQQLAAYGYAAQTHTYTYGGKSMYSVYATRVGTKYPDKMYIVAAHFDSYNTQSSGSKFAPGADDNASGSSLVLEAARVFAAKDIQTEYSVRFIIFNNEETGLNGAKAYVATRRKLQGVESPSGSGLYPEPKWLGMIQHDMILYDHGVPAAATQSPTADIDVEYQKKYTYSGAAITLAQALLAASKVHSADYPAQVSSNMGYTDSVAFQYYCPAVSVRENQRVAEIGKGGNPHWHKNSDVPSTYSAKDYLLGFNAVQMTTGAVAALAKAGHTGP